MDNKHQAVARTGGLEIGEKATKRVKIKANQANSRRIKPRMNANQHKCGQPPGLTTDFTDFADRKERQSEKCFSAKRTHLMKHQTPKPRHQITAKHQASVNHGIHQTHETGENQNQSSQFKANQGSSPEMNLVLCSWLLVVVVVFFLLPPCGVEVSVANRNGARGEEKAWLIFAS